MLAKDFLSERIIFGVLIILGFLLATATAAFLPIVGASHDVVTGAVGTLGTALGMVVQAVFRTDKTDKQTADTIQQLAQGVNSALATPAPGQ